MTVIGVVPSYKPDEKLLQTVRGAVASCPGIQHLVVVDDGSGSDYAQIFNEVNSLDERVEVLHLAVNSGMGGAIKAGLQ